MWHIDLFMEYSFHCPHAKVITSVHLYLVVIHPGGKNKPLVLKYSAASPQDRNLNQAWRLHPRYLLEGQTRATSGGYATFCIYSYFTLPKFSLLFSSFHRSHHIHQGPPSNDLLAGAAVTHRGLNELCPSVLYGPSSIIHLSQDGTEVFGGFSFQNEITTL